MRVTTTNIRFPSDLYRRVRQCAAAEHVSINDRVLRAVKVYEELEAVQKSGGRVIFEDAQGEQTVVRFI